MADPSWPSSPPETNYLRLVGPGATGTATTLTSATAWQALAVSNEVASMTSKANTASTALNFQGAGGLASGAAASGLNSSLQLLACWAQEKTPILASAVAAYETAVSTMIPAEISLANRGLQASHVAMNPLVLGALTPAIVALDTEYFGGHWAHNASAGAAYGSALTALLPALAVPPPVPPSAVPADPSAIAAVTQTAEQTVVGEAAGSVRSVAAGDAAGQVTQALSGLAQPLQSAVQPVMGMFQAPMQALQAMAGLPQGASGDRGGISAAALPGRVELPASVTADRVSVGGGAALGGGTPAAGLTSFTRPTSSFAPGEGGRPVSIKPGLLSATDHRGALAAVGGSPVSVSPAHAGMLGARKGEPSSGEGARARLLVASTGISESRVS